RQPPPLSTRPTPAPRSTPPQTTASRESAVALVKASTMLSITETRAMDSLLTYFISFKVIDLGEEGMEQAKAVMIITNDGQTMADEIYRQMGRTCTRMEGSGQISGDKCVLYCVVTRIELPAIRQIIRNADGSAFVTISDVSEIVGNHIKKQPAPQEEA
ncbi:MAG: YitT family protein, partial [Oscillospiraceae bacterium]|nr:YitT family protein [Oscillospiraceae bacterium]